MNTLPLPKAGRISVSISEPAVVEGKLSKGGSIATNTVTVNSQTPYRKGEYFRAELPMTNGVGPTWTNVTVAGTGQSSVTGAVFLAKTTESFTYDADGNLTQDGRWSYAWDGENRLVDMTGLSTGPAGSKFKLDFVYDSKGRRIQKLVSTNNGSVYGPQYTNRFVYDGWNLLAAVNPQSSIINSFVWGSDLSGSAQGAGGVGGLLGSIAVGINTNFLAYDGNGNVAALVNATDGTSIAQYEYGPFGEVIRATGPMAKVNPFRFSTKYQDDETDLNYYGFRYYNPSTGRWLSRDPIEENGGNNLYGFTANDPIDNVDVAGLLVGHVQVNPWQPVKTDSFLSHSRGWLFGVTWTPPTDGAWANPCACKPCQKVIWTQSAKFGKAGTFHIEIDESNYSKYGYAWDCTANSTQAALFDQPDQHGAFVSLFRSPYTFEARSMAKCVAGKDAGMIYAVVAWGFDWTYDGMPTGIGPLIVGQ